MKTNSVLKLFMILLVTSTIISCSNDDDFGAITEEDETQLIDFTIQTSLSSDIGEADLEDVTISLTNTTTGEIFETSTNENGTAIFDQLEIGLYAAIATLTLTKEEFENKLGYTPDTEEVTFNGAQENIVINVNVTSTNIELTTGKIGDLLIKQVYYAGSGFDGASFRDQFIEIYNNSNEILYADGLLVAQVYGSIFTGVADYTLENGQFDWTKSPSNQVGADANDKYAYADFVYQIPGNGTTYPINPGEGIVIATNAYNHKETLIESDGWESTVTDPSLTIDLSEADFEGYLVDYITSSDGYPGTWDVQNNNVPDLEIIHFKSGKDMVLNTGGADSFVIFTHDTPNDLPTYLSPDTSDDSLYMQIPVENIVDAVEVNTEDPTNLYPRQLPTALDAGYAYVPNGYFSSQSVIRKVEKEVNGRKVLFDTNNSSVDFTYLDMASPGAFVE
ncbi:DUF4876 domain-containing protein [Aquimarina pacifica]|uniref:DUF4876 domain-containing protein n=1 Tax=Aquimarina pacifica TaxID=1296415 RepID=UPI0004725F2D|nr:DUF4876 domain-containing protein [Aquimarina pacifica]